MSEPTEAAAATPKKSKMPLIMIAVGVLGLGGGGAFMFLGKGAAAKGKAHPKAHGEEGGEEGEHGEAAEEEEEAPAEEGGHGAAPAATNLKLDAFIANLASTDGEMHYVKCTLTVELANEKAGAALDKKMPRVRQDVLLYLSSLTLADTQGGESKRKIREALEATVRQAAGKKLIKNVYLVEFVIQ